MKGYSIKVIIVSVLCMVILTGCFNTQPECPSLEPIVKIKEVEVKVPVMPDIPKMNCEFKGKGVTPTKKLLMCLAYHKRVINLLRSFSGKTYDEYKKHIEGKLEELKLNMLPID